MTDIEGRAGAPVETYLLGGRGLLATGELAQVDLHLRAGRIVEVGTQLRPRAGAHVVELPDAIVTPGLVDAHAHLTFAGPGPGSQTMADVARRTEQNLATMLRAGVTTVRDVGGIGRVAVQVAAAMAERADPSPDVYAAGQILCALGGHGTEVTPGLAHEAVGEAGFRAAVRTQFDRGAHLIKVALNSGSMTVELSLTELSALVDEAHRLGLRVACHASIPEAIELAIRAGVDTIEHGNGATREQLQRMAALGIVLVPTVWIYQKYLADARAADAQFDAVGGALASADMWQVRVSAHETVVRDAIAAGVTLAVGTDAIQECDVDAVPHELLWLHRLGLDPVGALQAATYGGMLAIGDPGRTGLSEGARADLAVFASPDPAHIVTERQRPQLVFKTGRLCGGTGLGGPR